MASFRIAAGAFALTAFILFTPGGAAAQERTPSDIVSFLVTNQSVATGDFQKDEAAAAATSGTITRALAVNLATVPIPSSSSGFVYRLNDQLGTMERVSENFGAFFVERAATSGRGRFLFGTSATTSSFDRLDGLPLRDGTLRTTANQFRDEAAPFEVESLTLRVRTSTLTVFGTYGVTDRLEIGGAVPFGQIHLTGRRVSTYRTEQSVQATAAADASGVGDVAVRAKFVAVRRGPSSVAVAAEVRLPTGDEASLLGSGKAALRLTGVVSVEGRRWGAHANAGTASGGASSERSAAGALSFAVTPRFTLSGEVLVRQLVDLPEVAFVAAPHPLFSGVDTLRLATGTGRTILSHAVTGVKWNLGSAWVLGGHSQWRLGDGGLTSRAALAMSLDYLF